MTEWCFYSGKIRIYSSLAGTEAVSFPNTSPFLMCSWLPGLSKPVLQLNNSVVDEGEKLIARCMAPRETGSIFFYFYEDGNEITEKQVGSNYADAKLQFSTTGNHRIHCAYVVSITPDSIRSENSNNVIVSVKGTNTGAHLHFSKRWTRLRPFSSLVLSV